MRLDVPRGCTLIFILWILYTDRKRPYKATSNNVRYTKYASDRDNYLELDLEMNSKIAPESVLKEALGCIL
jgi:hypothetical protein